MDTGEDHGIGAEIWRPMETGLLQNTPVMAHGRGLLIDIPTSLLLYGVQPYINAASQPQYNHSLMRRFFDAA